ncbi:hypothetical protein CMQ_1906 [Grosmannia clavigera kw1407]|uniref:Thioredoxin-like fold domain-containing protein n=1 Tax=Grosmannia clavigera (strain kw1407 / UAMH 11150) TaxID=655863 RepID=F0XN10_GROCL|nr:uncharacterized protein CMQ_1906 [Grosmannia clavigera kw1407]EFX00825.1 hypothetical protein CMQ_1906 [Grosmannia clavigera kw1407]
MAVPPQFKAHRLVFTDLNKAVAASAEPLHTLEVFLDYVCPYSAKFFNTLVQGVAPQLAANPTGPGSRLQVVFRHQVQPWHPSSTLVHEAGLAVQRVAAAAGKPQLFWDFSTALFADQKAYMDVNVVAEGRNATYRRLAALAASSTGGAVDADTIYELLAIPDKPAADGTVNVGNAITNDLKWTIKYARLLGVHVSPTAIFDGVVANDISSSWTVDQWLTYLDKNAV